MTETELCDSVWVCYYDWPLSHNKQSFHPLLLWNIHQSDSKISELFLLFLALSDCGWEDLQDGTSGSWKHKYWEHILICEGEKITGIRFPAWILLTVTAEPPADCLLCENIHKQWEDNTWQTVTCDVMPSVWEAAVCLFLVSCVLLNKLLCCYGFKMGRIENRREFYVCLWRIVTLLSGTRCSQLHIMNTNQPTTRLTGQLLPPEAEPSSASDLRVSLSPSLPPSLPVRVTPPFCMRAAPVLLLPLVRQMVPCRPFLSASKWLQTESTSPSGRRFSSAAAAPISRTRNFCRCCFYAQVPNLEKEPSVPRLPLRCQL